MLPGRELINEIERTLKDRVRSLNLTIYFYFTYFVKFKDLTPFFHKN
jgi:hypothetical protein